MKTTIHNGQRITVTAEHRRRLKMYFQRNENIEEVSGETTEEWLERMHVAKRGPDVGDVERQAVEW